MTAICEDWRLFILKCGNELSSDISYDLVAPSLIERGIISADEHSKLSVSSENESRVKSLINLLASVKGEAVYFRFLDYLETDYDWLALQIKECTLTIEEREKYNTLLRNNRNSHLNENGKFRSLRSNTAIINCEVKNSNISENLSNEDVNTKDLASKNLHSYDKTGYKVQNLNESLSSCSSSIISNVDVNSTPACSTPSHSSHSPAQTPPKSDSNSIPNTSNTSLNVPVMSANGLNLNIIPLHGRGSSPNPPAITPCSSLASVHSTNGSSPIHSSNISIFSSTGSEHSAGDETTTTTSSLQQHGVKRGYQDSDEINEEMLEYVSSNPLIMKKWQSLAHQTGLSSRVPVIQARIRGEGRDFDEHVTEFFREWMERKPGEATIGGLISLLRKLRFNETAMRIEDGSYRKKLKSF